MSLIPDSTRYIASRQSPGFIEASLDDGIKRGVEQALNERVRRVVGAGGFAIIASGGVERKGAGINVDGGMEFEQRFVDGAEFFGTEVAVVDDA
ncbi:MAG: hypothetical protein KDN22_29985, partial [Verrucomicrobiae bacterium]|nr:hypothetical protein [Verrucomicrobiae bacterium]